MALPKHNLREQDEQYWFHRTHITTSPDIYKNNFHRVLRIISPFEGGLSENEMLI